MFPGIPTAEVPIGYVTNGIHTESWLHRDMIKLFDNYLGANWRNYIQDASYWDKILDVPDDIFWNTMIAMKSNMMQHFKSRYNKRLARYGNQNHGYPDSSEVLRDDILTIGFARRFAPYKRATLMFKDPERLKRILNNPEQPVQILFAGKARMSTPPGITLRFL